MSTEGFTISCDTCVMRATRACDDCLVTFITERDPEDAVVIDVEVMRSMRKLTQAGLLSPLRHREQPVPVPRRVAR